MPRLSPLLLLAALTLPAASCSDANLQDRSRCDGVLNTVEERVDDGFDLDGDGFFDANSSECQATYDASQLDCNDDDPGVNPGTVEVTCDDLDNDCDPDTLDAPDRDEDGFTPCEGDCDDNQPLVGPEETEVACDGLDNDCDEETEDAQDIDFDGFACDDCDDEDPLVNPGQTEEQCNGADDDCNELTPDGDDFDGDGMIHCFDCDDADPNRWPGNLEICEDGIDQDCDEMDAACPPPTWDGLWSTAPAINYTCTAFTIAITSVTVVDTNPNISFSFSAPVGTLSGTLGAADSFSATTTVAGLCQEDYSFVGSFTGPDSLSGTLTATFTDSTGTGIACADCITQTWNVTGTR